MTERLPEDLAPRNEKSVRLGIAGDAPNDSYFGKALEEFREDELTGIQALDLGCGPAFSDLKTLGERGAATLLGIDVFDQSTRVSSGGLVEYIRADIDESNIPVSDMRVDIAVLDRVIEHLYNPMHVLDECMRVLKPRGNLIIITPNQARLKNRVKLLLGGSIYYPLECWVNPGREWVSKRGRVVFGGHIREYTANELVKMTELAGFRTRSLKMLQAMATTPVNSVSGARSIDAIEARFNFKGALSLYNAAEKLLPSSRTKIAVIASKD